MANDLFINEQIREKEVRVVSESGEQLGVMPKEQAQRLADEADLDLVNISPKANPPVCKIMDYGKYKFEQGKRQKEAKKNQKTVEIKEMRLSATIDLHDMEIKAKNVRKFLAAGDKVKVSIRFRGRQLAHTDKGRAVMTKFIEMLDDTAAVEKNAKMEGRSMFMVLTPKGEKEKPKAEKPKVEKPKVEKPIAEKPAAEKPVVEKPVAEKSAAKEPAAEKPTAKESPKEKTE